MTTLTVHTLGLLGAFVTGIALGSLVTWLLMRCRRPHIPRRVITPTGTPSRRLPPHPFPNQRPGGHQ